MYQTTLVAYILAYPLAVGSVQLSMADEITELEPSDVAFLEKLICSCYLFNVCSCMCTSSRVYTAQKAKHDLPPDLAHPRLI